MSQPTTQAGFSPPWFLIIGIIAGVALIAFIISDSSSPPKRGHVVEITEANWQKEVVDSDIPVVVDFTASWCPPCKAFAPTLERIAERYKGKVKVGKLDVGTQQFEKAETLAPKYQIGGIPYVVIFKGSDRPWREYRQGAPNEAELARALDAVLAAP